MTLQAVRRIWDEGTTLWGDAPIDFERLANTLTGIADEDLLAAWETLLTLSHWPFAAQIAAEARKHHERIEEAASRERSAEIINHIRQQLNLPRKPEMVDTCLYDTVPTIPGEESHSI